MSFDFLTSSHSKVKFFLCIWCIVMLYIIYDSRIDYMQNIRDCYVKCMSKIKWIF